MNNRYNQNISFSLRYNKETEQYHIFHGTFNPKGSDARCTRKSENSMFGKMNKSLIKHSNVDFTCLTEQKMREKCAEIGVKVCGVCVSTLYADE